MKASERKKWLDFTLRLFADVRPGVGPTSLLPALHVFLILMAYYALTRADAPVGVAYFLSIGIFNPGNRRPDSRFRVPRGIRASGA